MVFHCLKQLLVLINVVVLRELTYDVEEMLPLHLVYYRCDIETVAVNDNDVDTIYIWRDS